MTSQIESTRWTQYLYHRKETTSDANCTAKRDNVSKHQLFDNLDGWVGVWLNLLFHVLLSSIRFNKDCTRLSDVKEDNKSVRVDRFEFKIIIFCSVKQVSLEMHQITFFK